MALPASSPIAQRARGLPPVLRAYGYWSYQFRRTWRGVVVTTVLTPVLYLLALGYGLGSLLDAQPERIEGVRYIVYIAPGLLATSAIQTAIEESTWPVLGAVLWRGTYPAMLATALALRDVLLGHLLWVATRVLQSAASYVVVISALGLVAGPSAVLAVPSAVLTGVAVATPVMAFAAHAENDARFALLFRFGLLPMFLFSGVFFPVGQLPAATQPLAWASPMWHGVELCRAATLGRGSWVAAGGHVAYLGAWAVVGALLSVRSYRTRLTD